MTSSSVDVAASVEDIWTNTFDAVSRRIRHAALLSWRRTRNEPRSLPATRSLLPRSLPYLLPKSKRFWCKESDRYVLPLL